MKSEIENRIYAVTGYRGSQPLPGVLAASWKREAIGSDPNWVVARACMTPTEYQAWGRDGAPHRFLAGKSDVAQRCIDACRRLVEQRCDAMGLICDWNRIPDFLKRTA